MERERFPRGTLPPSVFMPLAPGKAATVAPAPSTLARTSPDVTAKSPRGTCDLASTCPVCTTLMQPEHAHYRCLTCGYRDSCCF